MTPRYKKLAAEQLLALRQFARLGVSVQDFLAALDGLVRAVSLEPSNREIDIEDLPPDLVVVDRADVLWVLRCYLKGRFSGWELSNWAGFLLAMHSFSLPEEDDVLSLLTDLAAPLREDYLDHETIRRRMISISGQRSLDLGDGALD